MRTLIFTSSAIAASAAFVGQPHFAPQQQQPQQRAACNVYMAESLKLGTRGSPLALAQAY